MSGGLYRSAHAAPDGEPEPSDGAMLISVDSTGTLPTAAADQALPPEVIPPAVVESSGGGTVYGSTATQEEPAEEGPAEESRSTAGNSAIMAAGSLVSRLIGFVRNMLIGMTLGAGVGDAYTSAQFLPNQIYELLLGGILSSVLIPLLVRRRKADPDAGELFTQRLLTFAVVSLGLATVLVTAGAGVITWIQSGSGTTPGYRDLVTALAYLILPIIFFTGLSALIAAVLNVRGHFAAPMWAPILNNLVVIATCGVFITVFGTAGPKPENMSTGEILLIGGGTLLGMVVQALGLLPALRKVGFSWRWRWAPRALGLGEIGRLAGWMLCYVGANQLAVFLVVRVLGGVSDGSKASTLAFNNVFLLTMMAHGIVGVSVMTALLPKMSSAAAEGRYADVSADLSRGIRLTTTALAPIAVAYGVLGVPIAVTLFQGGALNYDQAFATGRVLVVAAFAVIPLSVSYLCTYAFYSLQGNKTVALINLPVVAVRIIGYLVLSEVLSQSLAAAGMTAANAVSYLVSALISLAVLRRRIGRLNLGSVAGALVKVVAAAAVATAAGLLVVHFLPGGDTPGRLTAALQVVIGGGAIMLAYLVAATLFKVHEVNQVVGMVRRKLGR
ncbi:murein biosynthesis integral membrane protein MurJ [Actinoplanes sp. NPDC049681]|uniref:murein biosynthesis integral membrane protein MurJ n=1 Tax=Actinoplanes sp. NPDC049681 TaxID=3363905 RepID=UPI0037884047